MKIKQQIFCEHCDNPISPQDGFIIQGNVYVITKASTNGDRPGIIGNNIGEDGDVHEVAWHRQCLIRYLSKSLEKVLR